jgi:hypothetical protein
MTYGETTVGQTISRWMFAQERVAWQARGAAGPGGRL